MKQRPQNKDKIKYNPSEIEPKWQAKWQTERVYQPDLDSAKPQLDFKSQKSEAEKVSKSTLVEDKKPVSNSLKKGRAFYDLGMFPYPSAEGMHVGLSYTSAGIDAFARFHRMLGYEVINPMGLDGFGIHSENHAIKTNTHPIDHAKRTEENFYRQLHETGNSYAWENKLETYDPDYYRWTQWLFVQLFNANLAYKKKSPVNYCPSCKTVLSDEQVIDGACERCNSVVEKKELEQWFFKITHFAERLLNNIESLDWTEKVKLAQTNWIGKKEGINITYQIEGFHETVTIFTTRPDTNFGATFIALAPEHELVSKIIAGNMLIDTQIVKKIKAYIDKAKNKSEIERQAEGKEKSGVFTGLYATNPLTGYQMPVWVSDFVLGGFGTGALVGVPGHDKRDFEFATKFGLEIIRVVKGKDSDVSPIIKLEQVQEDEGTMINSGFLNGMDIHTATQTIMDHIEKEGYGRREVTYHLRDWLISRQRYWGPPIPMIYCETCAKRKPKILLIHGLSGGSQENWFPWFKKEMVERGYEVLIPDLPDSDTPDLATWLKVLKALPITKEDRLFVVGHSLGAPTATQFIKKNGLSVEKLVLVAPTGKELETKHWKALKDAGLDQKGIQAIKDFSEVNEDLSGVAALVKSTTVFVSETDPYIPATVVKSYQELSPKVVNFPDKAHFNGGAGIRDLPEILSEFPESTQHNAGWSPVPEKDLPVKLPYIENFKPLGTGKSPLANHPEFYETTCPQCGGKAIRETDVSDTFLDSAWYFLRYLTTDLKNIPFPMSKLMSAHFPRATAKEREAADKRRNWLPVTMYIGGAEHSVLHLLYARFVTMALHDMGYLDFEEPFTRFYAHGLIIKDGAKMSKSKGNVINPDEYIAKYGADTLRTYLMFLGPFNQGGDFRDSGIEGMHKFLKRVWILLKQTQNVKLKTQSLPQANLRIMHETIKGMTDDLEQLRFNTAISKLMIWYNFLSKQKQISKEEAVIYLKLFASFAPHMAEELYQAMQGEKGFSSIHLSEWPSYDEKYLKQETLTVAVQINGKLRGTLIIAAEDKDKKAMIEAQAKALASVVKFLRGDIKQVIYIPGKILNFVIR